MHDLQGWQKKADTDLLSQKLRLTALEEWKSQAAPIVSQAVSTSRFEAFVDSRFKEVEGLAHSALPRKTFEEYVQGLQKDSPTQDDVRMGTTGLGFKRPGEGPDSNASQDSPAETTKRRNLSRQRQQASGADAFAALSSPSGSSSSNSNSHSSVSSTAVSGPPWLRIEPAKKDPWNTEALDLLFAEWSSDMDIRFQAWVGDHGPDEMANTARQLITQKMSPAKRDGITAVLRATRTLPRVFTNLPPPDM